jgi:hypothetical protein
VGNHNTVFSNETGVNCYMNAALQLLLAMPGFRKLLDLHGPCEPGGGDGGKRATDAGAAQLPHASCSNPGCIVRALAVAVRNGKGDPSGSRRVVVTPPEAFRQLVEKAKLKASEQQDGGDFLSMLLDAIQETCGAQSALLDGMRMTVLQEFWSRKGRHGFMPSELGARIAYLGVEGSTSVADAFRKWIETAGPDALRSLEAPGSPDLCIRGLTSAFHDVPDSLCIRFKRFHFGGGRSTKDTTIIPVNRKLVLNYLSGADRPRYELNGVIVHIGEGLDSGHFITYIRAPDGKWLRVNDETVTEVGFKDVRECQAYICSYIRATPPTGGAAGTDTGRVTSGPSAATSSSSSSSSSPPAPPTTTTATTATTAT